MLNRFLFCICISLLGSSCAPLYSNVMEQYRNASNWYESISEFSFETLHIGDKKEFYINEKSPVYMFKTGKSYFKAFMLPQSSYPYQVSVASCVFASYDPDFPLSYVFFPQLLTLNENLEVVRSSYPADFRAREVILTEIDHIESILEPYCSWYVVAGRIAFTEENKAEKYLVILTTNELLKAQTSFSTWTHDMILVEGIPVPGLPYKVEVLLQHSPAGLIMLSVQTGLF
ncbi:MAG: MalM family protein [Planctomycetota bacterium]